MNGSLICGSIFGSVLALTIFAPHVVHAIMPKVLDWMGVKLEKKKEEAGAEGQGQPVEPSKVASLDVYQFDNGITISIPKNITADQLKFFKK